MPQGVRCVFGMGLPHCHGAGGWELKEGDPSQAGGAPAAPHLADRGASLALGHVAVVWAQSGAAAEVTSASCPGLQRWDPTAEGSLAQPRDVT